MALLENFAQRRGDCCIVLLAGNLFFSRAIQTDQMIRRNPAFIGIKFRQFNRVGDSFVVNDDCRVGEWLLRGPPVEQEQEKKKEKRPATVHLKLSRRPSYAIRTPFGSRDSADCGRSWQMCVK